MKVINVTIRNKIAKNNREYDGEYICGNSDFVIVFDFDEEWDAFTAKTARFKYNGLHRDVVFTGNQVNVPIIENAHTVEVGVYAGNLHTTTPAIFTAKKSILCGTGVPAAPSDDVYAQIMEMLSNIEGVDPEAVEAAVKDYMAKNPVKETDPTVPEWAKAEKKPTYTAAEVGALPDTTVIPTKASELENDAGYLTEHQDLSEYAKTKDIPNIPGTLPNPNKLTFTGAVNATYDGSEAVSVEIPQGGGGSGGGSGFIGELLWECTTDGETGVFGNSEITFPDGLYAVTVNGQGKGTAKELQFYINNSNGGEGIRLVRFTPTVGDFTNNSARTIFVISDGLLNVLSAEGNGNVYGGYGTIGFSQVLTKTPVGCWAGMAVWTSNIPPANLTVRVWRLM